MSDTQKRITVALSEDCYEALRKYAYDTNKSLSGATKQLCEEGLACHLYGSIKNNMFIKETNK